MVLERLTLRCIDCYNFFAWHGEKFSKKPKRCKRCTKRHNLKRSARLQKKYREERPEYYKALYVPTIESILIDAKCPCCKRKHKTEWPAWMKAPSIIWPEYCPNCVYKRSEYDPMGEARV